MRRCGMNVWSQISGSRVLLIAQAIRHPGDTGKAVEGSRGRHAAAAIAGRMGGALRTGFADSWACGRQYNKLDVGRVTLR